MKKIILAGYMGSGKTSVGKELSVALKLPFIDLDHYIEEKEQLTINELFKQKGEIYFRKQEHQILKQLISNTDAFVLSLGGGTPCYANNHLLLQSTQVVSIYLQASINTLVERLQNASHRPLLANVSDLKTYIATHILERTYFYNFSHYQVNVDNKDITTICNEIQTIISKHL